MSFVSDHSSAFQAVFARTAVPVTYNGAVIQAVVTYDEGRADVPGAGGLWDVAHLQVMRGDVPAPAYRDTVVIDGASWRVQRPVNGDEIFWRLMISRNERVAR